MCGRRFNGLPRIRNIEEDAIRSHILNGICDFTHAEIEPFRNEAEEPGNTLARQFCVVGSALDTDHPTGRADGSGQRRLTEAPGYDGGPFFSADGSKIVWRRFDKDGLIADVWTMNPDGSEQTQITDFGAMSWAPYFHPSGEYIFFASNKLGFTNFEIFMVDAAGEKEPVRVTTTDGFDGLPVPTPDGKGLVWTSNRHNGGEGNAQLFMAQWDHDQALAALAAAPPREIGDT